MANSKWQIQTQHSSKPNSSQLQSAAGHMRKLAVNEIEWFGKLKFPPQAFDKIIEIFPYRSRTEIKTTGWQLITTR